MPNNSLQLCRLLIILFRRSLSLINSFKAIHHHLRCNCIAVFRNHILCRLLIGSEHSLPRRLSIDAIQKNRIFSDFCRQLVVLRFTAIPKRVGHNCSIHGMSHINKLLPGSDSINISDSPLIISDNFCIQFILQRLFLRCIPNSADGCL
ncbi:Uncharacterised protein [Mycobacteroides abscessus subsp. abscessus]|nr:Uncharacterised protein [Mycobacteroides abscessus subsp. abscessus]